eukprot:XP_014777817.1 PREDICTED: mucin-5AC-like isoform X2 [Octopus bimaculoides]
MEFITSGKLVTVCMHLALLMILMKTQHVETSSTKQETGRNTLSTILSSLSSATPPTPPVITTAAITVAVSTAAVTATATATTAAATTTASSKPALSHVVISTVTDGASPIYLTSQPPTVKTLGPSLRPTVRNQTVLWNSSTRSQHKTTSNFYSATPFPSKLSTTNAVLNETPQSKSITTVVSHTTKLKYPITSSTNTIISKVTHGRSSLRLLNVTKTSFEKGSTSVQSSLSTSTSTLVSTSAASLRSSLVSLGTTTSKKPEIRSTPVLSTSPANTTKTAVTTTAWNISTEQSILDINITGATSKESQKLTTEEQVATGICVPLFVLSILGLIYFFYKRKILQECYRCSKFDNYRHIQPIRKQCRFHHRGG